MGYFVMIPMLYDIGWINRYTHILLGVLLAVLISGAGFFVYRWYSDYRDQSAQRQFSIYFDEYLRNLAQKEPQWDAVASRLHVACQSLQGTSFGAYCLVIQAQASLRAGQRDQALNLLDQAAEQLGPSSPLHYVLATQRALIKADSGDEALVQQAIQELVQLGHNEDNQQRDVALYYVGQYYWSHNRLADAKKAWQALFDASRHRKFAPSPWVSLVEERIQQIPG